MLELSTQPASLEQFWEQILTAVHSFSVLNVLGLLSYLVWLRDVWW